VAVAFTRAGRSLLPQPDLVLEPSDILLVSATLAGIEAPARAGRSRRRAPLMAETRSMFVLIAGGGRTGAQLASFLVSQHHEVVVIEHRPQILAHIHR
jgi:Trk K+ transport system NAD-binding subunit